MEGNTNAVYAALVQPIKITTPGDNVFIWGCLHLGHDPKWDIPLWKGRGYDSVGDHDMDLLGNWIATLNADSTIFLLGDTVFGYGADTRLREMLETMPFKHCYLLPGNHTAGWKQYVQMHGPRMYLGDKIVTFCPNYLEIHVDKKPIVLSHYALLTWNGQGHNSYHFYSHVHNTLKNSEIGRMYIQKSNALEVSVEHYKSPPSVKQLIQQLAGKEVSTPDHHGKDTQNPF